MGIPGITKFLEARSQYFENYKLSNCSLVIDGNNICNKLYNWENEHWKAGFSFYCYGGDYDKYAKIVKCFFEMLQTCNVTSYIVFDGCSENDKVPLIKQRLNERAQINSEITPTLDHPTYAIGAVALRYAFMDVVTELGLQAYTCLLGDANTKMASLAKHLNCPVLSADSDFYVSSALFIPISSMACQIKEENKNKFIRCKIHKIENLINSVNQGSNLHYLLPVLLGNNQFNTNIFSPFFKKFRIIGYRQKTIQLIFQWLAGQRNLETAISKILNSFVSKQEKCSILGLIKHTIMVYTPVPITSLLAHFDIEAKQNIEDSFNFKNVEKALRLEAEAYNDMRNIQVSEFFEQKVAQGQYPSFFIDMLLENRYFVLPNIEDCSKPDANSIGYNIMAAIHNILVQSEEKRLTVLRRTSDIELEEYLLPAYEYPLPSIEEIDNLNSVRIKDLIFKILEMNPSQVCQMFESLPEEWHLFVLSLKYSLLKSKFNREFIYSLIFCFITLNYVDTKLHGFNRSIADSPYIQGASQNPVETVGDESKFSTISEKDSVIFMQKVIKFFGQDPKDNEKTYDRGIMHSIAELQCVFLHLKYLNALFNYPFEDIFIYKVFDGTFIYNMTKKLGREADLKDYLATFLQDCPGIYNEFICVVKLLENNSIIG